MTNPHTIQSAEADAAIERLLVKAEPVSIVDGLFELADGGVDSLADRWNRAVYGRLQARLAERIRLEVTRKSG